MSLLAALVVAAGTAVRFASSASAAATSHGLPAATTFAYTGSQSRDTVPAGVELLLAEVTGGTAGSNNNYYYGATIEGYLKVTPRQRLFVDVGGAGTPAGGATFGGGGAAGNDDGAGSPGDPAWSGGGASDLRTTPSVSSALVVAAGSGGDGGSGKAVGPACDEDGGAGSGAASMLDPTVIGVTGGSVYAGQAANSINPAGALVPAGAGSATAAGAGGYYRTCVVGNPPDQVSFGDSNPGAAGGGRDGGAGGNATPAADGFITGAGGGGGGGYYGGGGGASGVIGCNPQCSEASEGDGGGSGSSFVSTRFLLATPLDQAGPAAVKLTPAIVVRTPAAGARYRRGRHLLASYACLKALAYGCRGTVSAGARVATSRLGRHTFDVTMLVNAGDARKAVKVAVSYTVVR